MTTPDPTTPPPTPPLPDPTALAAAYLAYLRAQTPALANGTPAKPRKQAAKPLYAHKPIVGRPKPRLRKRKPPGGITPVPKAKHPRKSVPNALTAQTERAMRLPATKPLPPQPEG